MSNGKSGFNPPNLENDSGVKSPYVRMAAAWEPLPQNTSVHSRCFAFLSSWMTKKLQPTVKKGLVSRFLSSFGSQIAQLERDFSLLSRVAFEPF